MSDSIKEFLVVMFFVGVVFLGTPAAVLTFKYIDAKYIAPLEKHNCGACK